MVARRSDCFGIFDLGAQRKVETFKSVAGIGQSDILFQIVCQLIPDQVGMNDEERSRQERLALVVITFEKMFRQQEQRGASDESEGKPNLLPPPTPLPKQRHEWKEHNNRSTRKRS